jgi:hypothetical protein
MPERCHDPELVGLEAALASLTPSPGRLNRDALLVRAGQESAPGAGWFWPITAVSLAIVVAVLGAALIEVRNNARTAIKAGRQPAPPAAKAVETTNVPPARLPDGVHAEDGDLPAEAPDSSASDYFKLRNTALRYGVDALPRQQNPPPGTNPSAPARAVPSASKAPAPQN